MISAALFVGIDRYQSRDRNVRNLEGCVGDMELMKATVADICGGLPQRTRVLTNGEATTQRVVESFEDLVQNVAPGQVGFLYYAGHGGEIENVDRSAFDPEAHDQFLVPHDFSMSEPILDDMLHAWFSRIPPEAKLVVILDSCHSGGMPQAPMSSEEFAAYEAEGWSNRSIGPIRSTEYSPRALQDLQDQMQRFKVEESETNTVLLAASQPNELAWERVFAGRKHGIFTYHVCEALRSQGTAATPIQLINHAESRIRNYRKSQMPRVIGAQRFFDQAIFAL